MLSRLICVIACKTWTSFPVFILFYICTNFLYLVYLMPKLVQRSYSSLGIILNFFTALIVSPPLWLFFDNSLFNVFSRYILRSSRRNWEFNFHELLWKYRLAAARTCTIIMPYRVCLRFQDGASPVVWLQLAGARGPHVNILVRTKEKMRVRLEQLRETQWQNNCCEI